MSKIADKWLQNPGSTTEVSEVPTGTINGINQNFVISQDPIGGSLKVFLDGLLDTDFTYDGPSKTITMITAPEIGQQIRAVYNT